MKPLFKNKRGNWVDILEYSRGILIFGLSILISYILLTSFNNLIISSAATDPLLNDTDGLSAMQGSVDVFPSATDYILPIIYVFFLGFSAWSARRIQSSHQFTFLALIMLLLVTLFAMFIETMWQAFTEQAVIAAVINNFPITNFFIGFLRYFVLFYGLIVGVALYAKET